MAKLTSELLVRLIDGVSAPARKAANSLLGIGQAARGVGGYQGRINAAIEKNNQALDRARGRMMDAVAGAYALKRALGAPIGAAVRFESAMADVAKVSGFDDAGIEKYGRQLRKLAVTEIPMAVEELAALSANAAQAGVADEELYDFTKMTAKAAVAWEMSGAQAGEALAKIKSQLRLTTSQTALFADAINHLSDNSAASAGDLVDYAKRVSAQGEFFGFAKEATLAFGSAMVGTGSASEVAATSFRNMGRALTRGASATKRQSAAYKALGLDAVKVSKAMQKNAVGTTLEVIDRLAKLPEHTRPSLISDLFGDEARAIAPLLKDVNILKNALKLVTEEQSYANSVGKEFERRARTTEYAWQRFKNQINDIGLAIGGALLPSLRAIMEQLGPIVLKFAEFTEANPELTRKIIAATSALIGFRFAATALSWLGLMGRGGALSMLALGFNTVGRAAIAARSAIGGTIAMQTALAGGQAYGGFAKFVDGAKALVRIVPGLNLIGPAVSAIAGALGAITAPVAAGIAAVAAAGFMIYKYWDRISSIFMGVGRALAEQLAPALEMARPVLDWLAPIGRVIAAGWNKAAEALRAFGEWIGSFFGREVLNDSQKAEWEQAGYEAATRMIEAIKSAFSGLVSWAAGIGSRIGSAISSGATSAINRVKGFFGYGDGGGAAAPAVSGARAAGGSIYGGRSYLVGEEGPEIITPTRSGYVHPSGSMPNGGVTLKQTNNIKIDGTSFGNLDELAYQIARKIEQRTRAAMHAVHADYGSGFAG